MTDRNLTPRDVAKLWQCSERHVYRMVKKGRLRGFRLGRLFRIKQSAVEEFECQMTIESDGSEENSISLSGETENENVTPLEPQTRARLHNVRRDYSPK